jgi:hypothetical protein
MVVKTGLNSQTPERVLVDAGAVYLDYGLSTQRLLGATRGGNEFNLNREIREVEVDGVKGPTKGLRRVTVVRPQLTCNLIELSLGNLLKAIAGATQDEATYQATVESEYLGDGDDTETLFTTEHDNIVQNTEKVYLDGVQQDRSKKYLSRFVGDNSTDNKDFDSGVGDWAKGHTDDTIEIVEDGYKGNALKYVAGASAVVGFLTLPGGDGAQLTNLVVGEHYRLQIAVKHGTWNGGDVTISCDAGEKTVTSTTSWVVHVIEFTATGTDASIELEVAGAPTDGDDFYIDFLELEKVDGDYVMNWDEGEVIFATAPTSAPEHITIGYTYATGANATHDVIKGGQVDMDSYIDNVALVGTISGKDQPVICIVKNALADTGFTITTAPRDEAVPSIVWTGHYDPADPDTEPWEIRYPRS